MIGRGNAGWHARRLACGLSVAVLGSGMLAAGASAARLKLTVPSHVKKGKGYRVQIDGSFSKSEVKGKAFLISLIQFSSKPCKRSAQAENAWADRTHALIQFYFAPNSDPARGSVGIFENKSPFTRLDGFTAGDLGTRHVCTYMYSKFIKPGDSLPPIARADSRYKVTRR